MLNTLKGWLVDNTITTQYTNGGSSLKVTRPVSTTITVGNGGSGGDDRPDSI